MPSSPASGSRRTPCSSWTAPSSPPGTTRSPSGRRTTGTLPNHQVVVDADTRMVVVVGRPLAGNRNDCKAWEESGAKAAVGHTLTIADGGYPGTGLVIPHRREHGQAELPAWKEEHNKSHKQVRARVEHVFARMKTWKILRDRRLRGDGVHHAMLGIARMHNLALAG
ncbi:transposase [Streptomyces sp. NPDC089424]|uniref:transposase n=1 Tax=Streptomyces sp. NPDC089424 TaxID=3365917 RepID=UPI0038130589